jgi:beta-glucanase (GH16 family)
MPDIFHTFLRTFGLTATAIMYCVNPASAGQNGPLGQDGSFELVFEDEFEGQELALSRWTTCYWWDKNGCTNLGNEELQWYMPDNVSLDNGILTLTARPEKVPGWEGRIFDYTSGMVTTGRYYEEDPSEVRFESIYGYFEMRAKVPSGQGLWPAFWMLPSTRESKPEIDIMEILGHRPNMLELHFHYRNAEGESRNVGHEIDVSDLSKDWHTYGVDWSPEAIVWYLDGKEMWRYEDVDKIPDEPLYMILNLAVGGNWPGSPDATTEFPARMQVDYVRAWKKALP